VETAVASMSSEYQVVVPLALRAALKLSPQDELIFVIDGETTVVLRRPADFTAVLRGLHKELWPDAAGQITKDRAAWE
jgi:bifunctional DNA-binding transcriptional regulator/antitoxin component of YhaV-PrlF toxin-antitoxin module